MVETARENLYLFQNGKKYFFRGKNLHISKMGFVITPMLEGTNTEKPKEG